LCGDGECDGECNQYAFSIYSTSHAFYLFWWQRNAHGEWGFYVFVVAGWQHGEHQRIAREQYELYGHGQQWKLHGYGYGIGKRERFAYAYVYEPKPEFLCWWQRDALAHTGVQQLYVVAGQQYVDHQCKHSGHVFGYGCRCGWLYGHSQCYGYDYSSAQREYHGGCAVYLFGQQHDAYSGGYSAFLLEYGCDDGDDYG